MPAIVFVYLCGQNIFSSDKTKFAHSCHAMIILGQNKTVGRSTNTQEIDMNHDTICT